MDGYERSRLHLKRLIKHKERSNNNKFYAIKRIDLLTISISTAGIYAIFELYKYANDKLCIDSVDSFVIKSAGVAFVFSILTNFISQWTGHTANGLEAESAELQISEEKGDVINQVKLTSIKKKIESYNGLTTTLNTIATLAMIIGIILLSIFSISIF